MQAPPFLQCRKARVNAAVNDRRLHSLAGTVCCQQVYGEPGSIISGLGLSEAQG